MRALDREPSLEGLQDDLVLSLAAGEQRILVTHDVAHFPRILQRWAAAGRSHAGVILVYGIGHREFGSIVRGVERAIERFPRADDWRDLTVAVGREPS